MKAFARAGTCAVLMVLALGGAGCADDPDDTAPPRPPPPPRPAVAPDIVSLELPIFPPLAETTPFDVRVRDDDALSSVTASFRGVTRKVISGTQGQVRFFGRDLGEGRGTLRVSVCDSLSLCRERSVTGLIVDMTPPEIELERAAVSPRLEGVDGQVAVWVSDDWVLGSVQFTFKGKPFRHEMPQAYPPTLGVAHDVSRIAFPAAELPEGAGTAIIVAKDAAGNERKAEVALRIDGVAPKVSLASPAPGARVEGSMTVRVEASDESGIAPTIDVWVGGARVLAGVEPNAPFVIDTTSLPPGPCEVRAVARDDAGNESIAALATVEIAP